jgi:Putative auto-transporter adhesin, head GIN domain
MRLKFTYLIFLLMALSCKKEQLDDCFSPTGKDVTIERLLPTFSRLEVGDKFNVVLTQDTGQERIRITGGKNIVEGIWAEVNNKTLLVENGNRCNFVRSYKREITIEIFLKDLRSIFVYGATSIISNDTLILEELNIEHAALEDMTLKLDISKELFVQSINSGGLTLEGRCNIFKASIEEITNVDARRLVCKEVLMDSHTLLDCYVNATELLFVKIYNKGNIYYVDEPSGRKEVNVRSGTGELLKL